MAEVAFWAVIGTIGNTPIAWSTVDAEGYDGVLMSAPSPYKMGPSEALGGAPELASTNIVLDNADRSFDKYFIGTNHRSNPPSFEFTSDSFYDLQAAIYRVSWVDNEWVKLKLSPTMRVVGDISTEPGLISLTLAVDDTPVLGPSVSLVTVEEYLADSTATVSHLGLLQRSLLNPPYPAPQTPWSTLLDSLRSAATENMEAIIPWTYGGGAFALTKVSSDDSVDAFFIGAILDDVNWYSITDNIQVFEIVNGKPVIHLDVYIWGSWFVVKSGNRHLLCFKISGDDIARLQIEDTLWVRPRNMGAYPANVISRIMNDHSELGSNSYDLVSYANLSVSTNMHVGTVAGIIDSDARLSEIIESFSPVLGMVTYVDTKNQVNFVGRDIDIDLAMILWPVGYLDSMDDYPSSTDNFPSWREEIPTDPDSAGSPISKITIEWPNWASSLYPAHTKSNRAAISRTPVLGTNELRLVGDWINPYEGRRVVHSVSDRATYPVRKIRIATSFEMATKNIGSIIRVTSDFGIGPWTDRYTRLAGIEIRPEDECCIVLLEDLGARQSLNSGILDSLVNWVCYDPASYGADEYMTLIFVNDRAYLKDGHVTGAVFEETYIGKTIWGPPSIHPDYLGVTSYEIVDFDWTVDYGTGVITSPPYSHNGSSQWAMVDSDRDLLDRGWLLLDTRLNENYAEREEYIAGADNNGMFQDGSEAFQYKRL